MSSPNFFDEEENDQPDFFAEQTNEPENNSFLKKATEAIVQNPVSQFGLGLANTVTWPADLAKLWSVGEGLSALEDLEERGIPVDREKFIQELNKNSQYFPTQELLEEGLEKLTGAKFSPQTPAQERARNIGSLFSFGLKDAIKQGTKKVLGRFSLASGGALTEEALEKSGAPKPVSKIAGAIITEGQNLKKIPKAVSPEIQKLRDLASKFNVRYFRGLESGKPKINPVVSQGREKALRENFSLENREAIDEIIRDKIPLKNLREQGLDVEKMYTDAYDYAYDLAKKQSKPVDKKSFLDFIDKKIAEIKKAAPSPSIKDKAALDILESEKKAWSDVPPKGTKPGEKKDVSVDQTLSQYKKYNENLSTIYRKAEFSGVEDTVRKTYEELKGELIKVVENNATPEVANTFQFANKVYHENAKLAKVEGIMDNVFKEGYDPKKLSKALEGKSGKFLERDLGKDAVDDLKELAFYGNVAEDKIFKALKVKDDNMIKAMEEWGKVGLITLAGGKVAGAAYKLGKPVITRARGYLFTHPSTKKSYIGFTKAVAEGNMNAAKRYSKDINDTIENNFGSFDNFIQEIENNFFEEEGNNQENPKP